MEATATEAIVARSRRISGPIHGDTVTGSIQSRGQAVVLEAHGPDRFRSIRAQAEAVLGRIVHHRASDVPDVGPAFVGGCAFHPDHETDGRWAAFPSAMFWLPQVQTRRVDGVWVETVIEAEAEERDADPEGKQNPMDWHGAVADATRAITHGDLAKVVLARDERHPPRDANDLFARLGAHRFRITPTSGHCLLGASPERLAVLTGSRLSTHALAGTAARSKDTDEDNRLGQGLLESQKDILEHELVASFIRERLAGLGAKAHRSPRRLLRLETVQHLETAIEADMPDGTHVLDIVEALHPTPAVGGSPQRTSLGLMRRLETFPRGWYAGPIGWFDGSGDGAFQVALRCALLTPHDTWLFAGAGIVAGSDADAEMAETESKLEAMRRLL